jgi:hypothetical protein
MPGFEEWESFYVIVGAAAGALIGLQFVVMTLIAERPPPRAAETGSAFSTPTIVHFSAALLISALLRVPFHTITSAAALWGITGLSGVVYAALVARRMAKQIAYKPDLGDWLFFVVLPFVGYLILAVSAFEAPAHPEEALMGVGAATLLLLFMGIHNAWDSVAYLVYVSMQRRRGGSSRDDE